MGGEERGAGVAKPRVLVADDQADVVEALRLLLESEGISLEPASGPGEVLARARNSRVDAALIDLNYTRDTTSGREGLDLLAKLRDLDSTLPIVVMTAWGSVESAVEAMRRGARDYIEKPWDNERLLDTLRTQIRLGQALRRSRDGEGRAGGRGKQSGMPRLIATSRAMQPLLRIIERVAPSEANVLISGEHGTGKEVVARHLHAASSRSGTPLVTVNMGGLSEGVFESELFGHVKGAFTDAKSDRTGYFDLADGGTLFLDEIANTSARVQAKLLRVLERGDFRRVGSSRVRHADVRVLSATNADLAEAVSRGDFREDLLYRLNTVEIAVPPLRDRPEDLPLLADHFLAAEAARYGRPGMTFSAEASKALLGHTWPGNVRELGNAVERAVLMSEGLEIGAPDLCLRRVPGRSLPWDELKLSEVERMVIERAMDLHDGNVSHAARRLGLSRSALYRRLERYEIGGSS